MKKDVVVYAAVIVAQHCFAQQVQYDSLPLHQLQEVLANDSRFALKRENFGKAVIKITTKALKMKKSCSRNYQYQKWYRNC